MDEVSKARYHRILQRQLALNRETWATLEASGIHLEPLLHLDFIYRAPGRRSAEQLCDHLEDKTDYEVRVSRATEGAGFEWCVEGSTPPTAISPELLDQWVDWMVHAGIEFGCDFEGWGAAL